MWKRSDSRQSTVNGQQSTDNIFRCSINFLSPTDGTDLSDFSSLLFDSLFCYAKIAL